MKECPITLCPLSELSNPVAFSCDLDQPYELDALCTWMEANPVNPLTGREAHIGDLVALGDVSQQQSSAELMERRNLTIIENQVLFLKMTEMQPLIQNSVLNEYKVSKLYVSEFVYTDANVFRYSGMKSRTSKRSWVS
jgi:hypothetical protein